jgi:NitT/TauT family transport system substrate-binding protein
MKLKTFALALSAAATVILGGVPGALAADKALTITEPSHSIDSMPFYVAQSEGFFKKRGLDITLYTEEGGSQAVAAVLSGSATAFIGGPEHNAFALLKGGKQIKAVLSLSNRANAYIVARADLNITKGMPLKEIFKGRTIAVGAQGGTQNSLLRAMIAREGLDPAKDVTLLEVNTNASTLAAMKAKRADLAVTLEPLLTQGVKEGIWSDAFVSFPAYFGAFEYTTLNVPETLIKSDPQTVKAMADALKEALTFSFANPDKIKELARKEFPTMPVGDLDAMLKRTLEDNLWQPDGKTEEAGWKQVEGIVRDAGLLSRDVTYAEIFDPEFQ